MRSHLATIRLDLARASDPDEETRKESGSGRGSGTTSQIPRRFIFTTLNSNFRAHHALLAGSLDPVLLSIVQSPNKEYAQQQQMANKTTTGRKRPGHGWLSRSIRGVRQDRLGLGNQQLCLPNY
ncbi:hypothetical protein PMIN06_009979 [Paraphaeosphaeria minitans]